jgi:FtsZ-interacting cell division protein ZipA
MDTITSSGIGGKLTNLASGLLGNNTLLIAVICVLIILVVYMWMSPREGAKGSRKKKKKKEDEVDKLIESINKKQDESDD